MPPEQAVVETMDKLTQEPGEGPGQPGHPSHLPGQASKQASGAKRNWAETGLMLQQEGVRLDSRTS